MRVDQHYLDTGATRVGHSGETGAVNRGGEARSNGAAGNDELSISGVARRVNLALEASETTRAARVSWLAGLVSQGRYDVDSGAVASAMVEDMLAAPGLP